MHNIAKSVLILDEVQTLPLEFLRPIVDTLKTLNHIFCTSILFTTASQPTLSGYITGTHNGFEAIDHINEIVPTDANLHIKLKRVDFDINDTPQSYDEISEQIAQHDRVLCIVNTRRDAKELFDRLPKDEGTCLHLSRMMCPKHIKDVLKDLKCQLKDSSNKIIKVVATQLIEAGVDIDFPVVYRQQAGLDSILQAAGRCNREGRYGIGTTHVFSLEKEHALPRGFIADADSARKNMVGGFNWFSAEAISEYFRQRYARINNFDKAGMADKLYKLDVEYEEAANCFHLIDEQTSPVIVNWRNSMSLIQKLKGEGPSYDLMKQLAQYSVSVRQHDFKLLLQAGAIEEVLGGFFVISSPSFYDEHIGLKTDNQWLEESFIL